MLSDNTGNVVDYGGETDHRGIGRREHLKESVSGRAHREKRECQGSRSIYRANRRDDRAKTCVIQ